MTKELLLSSFRPSALATLHYLPRNSEIVIHTSHWRMDLFGALGLLNNLFTVLNEPRHVQFGEEGCRLSPGRDEVAGFNSPEITDSPAAVRENATASEELAMQLFRNLPSIGFPMKTPLPKPAGTSRSESMLESSTTATIISAIKARGLSVTTALHAALIVALQQLTSVPPSSSYKYTTYGIFNVRPFLEPPHNDPFVNPATLQMIGLPLTLNTSTYQTLVSELKPYYKQRLPPATDSVLPKQLMCPYTKFMAQVVGSPPPSDLPPLAEPMFNSVGIVDDYLSCKYCDSIKIQDFWVGVEMLTPQVECYVWTWQKKMTLSAMYNDAFYESQFIQGFLRRILDVLFAELNIQED